MTLLILTKGHLIVFKSYATNLRQRSGAIINLSSIVYGNPGQANYVATKAGIEGLTNQVRELASRGIITRSCAWVYRLRYDKCIK